MSSKETIESFYKAFAKLDAATISQLYADHAKFEDPVFGKLNASQTRAMWAMLLGRAKDFHSTFKIVEVEQNQVSAILIAEYLYGKRKRKVINHIRTAFKVEDGKIVDQVDKFNFWRWSTMAMGTFGFAIGWTSFFRNKVKKEAVKSLDSYMNQNKI